MADESERLEREAGQTRAQLSQTMGELRAWQLSLRWRKWPAYAVALPIFLVALFYFFENFSRLLPSNY